MSLRHSRTANQQEHPNMDDGNENTLLKLILPSAPLQEDQQQQPEAEEERSLTASRQRQDREYVSPACSTEVSNDGPNCASLPAFYGPCNVPRGDFLAVGNDENGNKKKSLFPSIQIGFKYEMHYRKRRTIPAKALEGLILDHLNFMYDVGCVEEGFDDTTLINKKGSNAADAANDEAEAEGKVHGVGFGGNRKLFQQEQEERRRRVQESSSSIMAISGLPEDHVIETGGKRMKSSKESIKCGFSPTTQTCF